VWKATFEVPVDFFLRGWVQVLHPSEVATWLIMQWLAQTLPGKHVQSGVYLYANTRKDYLRLRRDSYEDACNRLLEFGLLRYAQPGAPVISELPSTVSPALRAELAATFFSQPARSDHYEPDRYQVANDGLTQDALATCLKETILRKKVLEQRRGNRVQAQDPDAAG
jgi:hypothetical protein